MGRLNNKADCKSFMTENDHSAVHRPAALSRLHKPQPGAKNVWRCVVLRPVCRR